MKRFRFEVHHELIIPVDVVADSELRARELIIQQDEHVTAFDTLYGDMQLVLCSVDDV